MDQVEGCVLAQLCAAINTPNQSMPQPPSLPPGLWCPGPGVTVRSHSCRSAQPGPALHCGCGRAVAPPAARHRSLHRRLVSPPPGHLDTGYPAPTPPSPTPPALSTYSALINNVMILYSLSYNTNTYFNLALQFLCYFIVCFCSYQR